MPVKALGTTKHWALPTLFACASFLGAWLLFLSELITGKLLLPVFGGSAAVWTTCMVFFQAMLLLGYLYAHLSTAKLGMKYQSFLQMVLLLLPLLVLPFVVPGWAAEQSGGPPILNILAILLVVLGLPFFVLSGLGPLLQRYFSLTRHLSAKQPYFLYAAGNAGSLAALFAYPLFIEPRLTLKQQAFFWAVGYAALVCAVAACMYVMRHYVSNNYTQALRKKLVSISWKQRGQWLFLAFLPSSLLLGVTNFISTDVASVPLLWVVPLSIYLLTFIVAFGVKNPQKIVDRCVPWAGSMLFIVSIMATLTVSLPQMLTAVSYLALFALIALVAHGRLSSLRPDPSVLTEFYSWVALGGVVGGLYSGILAPFIFNDVYELPLALLLSVGTLVNYRKLRHVPTTTWLWAALPLALTLGFFVLQHKFGLEMASVLAILFIGFVLGVVALSLRRVPATVMAGLVPVVIIPVILLVYQPNLHRVRTFYGVLKVRKHDQAHILYHGVTQHGRQYQQAPLRSQPTTYYSHSGPLGDVMKRCKELSGCQNIGGIGLGVGTLAAYGEKAGRVIFYEIDPAVVKIAYDTRYFSYIQDSLATITTIVGDGRLSLQASNEQFDVLVVDAFTSDAIPTHLLTRDAIKTYREHLSSRGLLAIHISNRHLNLEPIIRALAIDQDLSALYRFDTAPEKPLGLQSAWVVLAEREDTIMSLENDGWRQLDGRSVRVWTDDYTNIIDALK